MELLNNIMNAQKAFEKTNLVNVGSFLDVKKAIANVVANGYYEFHYTKCLDEGDLDKLRDEGYVVNIGDIPEGFAYHFHISWQRHIKP